MPGIHTKPNTIATPCCMLHVAQSTAAWSLKLEDATKMAAYSMATGHDVDLDLGLLDLTGNLRFMAVIVIANCELRTGHIQLNSTGHSGLTWQANKPNPRQQELTNGTHASCTMHHAPHANTNNRSDSISEASGSSSVLCRSAPVSAASTSASLVVHL